MTGSPPTRCPPATTGSRWQELEGRADRGYREGLSAKQRTLIGTEARVELTLAPDPKVCKAAKTTLAAKRKAVNKLKAQLRSASSTKAKSRLRTKLTAAKAKQAKALKRVGQVC
jgi:hypothetical protein